MTSEGSVASNGNPFDLSGKAAEVTGAGRGIGLRNALAPAEGGARPVSAPRSQHELEKVANEVVPFGTDPLVVSMDVGDLDSLANLFPYGPHQLSGASTSS